MRRFLTPIILALLGIALAAKLVPMEQAVVAKKLASFPGIDAWSHQMRPAVLGLLCFIPALGALCYALSGIMTRYITRQFLSLLGICFVSLTVIWLLIDFQDNFEELKTSSKPGRTAALLYATRVPEIIITLLPYSLLLSLLFCLGRLSASHEIIAMIQTGRGLARLTAPFLVAGLLAAALCAGLNYQWAPQANASEQRILDSARGLNVVAAEFVQFRNPRAPRNWMVGSFPTNYQSGAPLQRIRVVIQDEDYKLKKILVANSASWSPDTGIWHFHNASLREFEPKMPPLYVSNLPDPYIVRTWRETPAEIIQPGLPADQLGIPDLNSWLKNHPPGSHENRRTHLTQWHHRWAQPFNCLIVVLLATPLGVVFSRRGTSGGVAVTVFLCAGLLFLTTISLSLGDAGHLPPMLAAWLPNLLFGTLAIYLFRRRLAGRPIYQAIRRLVPNEA